MDFFGFFDGVFTHVDEDGYDRFDREYLADDLAKVVSAFYLNGIFPYDSQGFQVMPSKDLEILVNKGQGHIEGRFFKLDRIKRIRLTDPNNNFSRIDRVVIRLNIPDRLIEIAVKEGELSTKPKPTPLTRNKDIYELGIADIFVRQGSRNITQRDITDTRYQADSCGVVAHALKRLDVEDLRKQYGKELAELVNWFDNEVLKEKADIEKISMDFSNFVAREREDIIGLVKQLNEILEGDDAVGEINKIIQKKQDKHMKDRVTSKKYELFFENGQLFYEEV